MLRQVLLGLTLITLATSAAAGVAQAGSYNGTLIASAYDYATGVKTPYSGPVHITILDTGVWICESTDKNNNTLISTSGSDGIYGAADCTLMATGNGYTTTIPLRFSTKGKVQGTLHHIGLSNTGFFVDGKLSLKKEQL